MRRACTEDELLEQWTLAPEERLLVIGKAGAHSLGFAMLLKFLQAEGRFPRDPYEIPAAAVAYVARQLQVPTDGWAEYDWKGRTIKHHRAAIREALGFRESTVADSEAVMDWATEHVLPQEWDVERVKAAVLGRYRQLRLEPPASDHLDRLVRSAAAQYEEQLCSTTIARLSPSARSGLDALLEASAGNGNEDVPAEREVRTPLHDLRTEPGKVSLETLQQEMAKLERVRAIGLPPGLFGELSPRILRNWRQQVTVEELYELRRHPPSLRLTLLVAYCVVREQELTDTLVDILLDMVHRIFTRAEERVEKRLQSDVRRVSGKQTLLFRLAEAAIAQPQGTVRDVLFPVVSERVLRALVEEARAIGPTYREQLQAVVRNAYRSHYRQMLTRLLTCLDFRTRGERNRPIMDALALIRKYIANREPVYPSEETVPIDDIVPELWRAIVIEGEQDGVPQVNRVAYEICVLGELRERLRTKEIWVVDARRYRDPEQDLPADFDCKRDQYYSALRLPQDAKTFISQVRQELEQELRLLDESIPQNKFVRILDRGRGWISLSPLGKQPEPQNLRHLKSELLSRWPNTSLLDVFKESDLRIRLTDVFRSATSFASMDRALLQSRLLLTLYGLGTNTGLKRIANGQTDTDYKDLLYVRRRFVTKEQLREAIRLVVNAIFEARDPRIWGEGTTACASDSKKFGAWDQNLMTEWHVRYGGRGVMVYWHVEKKSTCIYSQLKTCSSSEVAAMIEGVLRHCTSMEVEKNYVDSHGQSEVAFAFCRLLGFQLLPRLKAIHAQKLHPSEGGGKARHPHLAPVLSSAIDWDLIEAEYDSFVKYTTGLRLGTANAEDILRRFTRNNAQHPTYRALAELGQACKTIFLCRYLRFPALRREIHEGLQVVENWNSANAFIYFARGGEIASNRVDDQEIAMLSLHLLQICLVYINTLMIQRILAEPDWLGRLTSTDLRGLTPLVFTHINPYGTFRLDMNTRLPIEPPRLGPGAAYGQMLLYDERVG